MKLFLKIILLLSMLGMVQSAEAGPVSWLKRQVREHPVRTKLVFAGIAAGVYAKGLQVCRVQDVENCQEHYGAAWGGYASTVGLDLVAQLVGQKIGGKTGDVIAYGSSTTMLGFGAYQWHGGLNKPKVEDK